MKIALHFNHRNSRGLAMTSLYSRDRDSKNKLAYNEFEKRPRITVNLRIGSRETAISQLHIHKITDKKATHNKGRLYFFGQ